MGEAKGLATTKTWHCHNGGWGCLGGGRAARSAKAVGGSLKFLNWKCTCSQERGLISTCRRLKTNTTLPDKPPNTASNSQVTSSPAYFVSLSCYFLLPCRWASPWPPFEGISFWTLHWPSQTLGLRPIPFFIYLLLIYLFFLF